MSDTYINEFVGIIQEFVRLKSRLKPVQPIDDEVARIRRQFMESHPSGKGPMADMGLLFHIGILLGEQADSLTMSELSQALEIPMSSATRIMDWLVTGGYAERRPDPADRRVVRVALSETGQHMYKLMNQHIRKRVEHVLHHFTTDEQESLIKLMTKLVKALEEEPTNK
jgi:DNA-binding MarR family transcriptional regulator